MINLLQMQEMGVYFWVVWKALGSLQSAIVFLEEWSEMVAPERFTNGSHEEGCIYIIPWENSCENHFTHGISLSLFSLKCLANGARERHLESQDCSKDRAETSLGFAAVSFMGIGGSICVEVVSDLASLSIPKTSLGIVSCGTVEKSGTDCQKWVRCSSWVSCRTEGARCSQQPW